MLAWSGEGGKVGERSFKLTLSPHLHARGGEPPISYFWISVPWFPAGTKGPGLG